jgi:hypothetical protein
MEEQMAIISELEETIEMVSRYSARVDNRTRKLERKVVDLTEELEKLQNLMERLVDRDNFRVNNILKKKIYEKIGTKNNFEPDSRRIVNTFLGENVMQKKRTLKQRRSTKGISKKR